MAHYCPHGWPLPGPPYLPTGYFPGHPPHPWFLPANNSYLAAPAAAHHGHNAVNDNTPVLTQGSFQQSGFANNDHYDEGYNDEYDDEYDDEYYDDYYDDYYDESDNEPPATCPADCACDWCCNTTHAPFLLASPLIVNNLPVPHKPTRIVFRATAPGVPWDTFDPFVRRTDPFVQHRLWACDGKSSPYDWRWGDLDAHIQMGFGRTATHYSPFISFTTDLKWAVYHTLKQEFVGGEARPLYQIQVPDEHIIEYGGHDEVSHGFAASACEVFAHRFVDVYSYQELSVRADVREFSRAWFLRRKAAAKTKWRAARYPFDMWRRDVWRMLNASGW